MDYVIEKNIQPQKCPNCESEKVTRKLQEIEEGTGWIGRECRCDYCGLEWNETYTFNFWEPTNEKWFDHKS